MVNGMNAHVLFDSGATRSFLSLALSKKFCDDPRTLDFPLEVEITDDRTMSASRLIVGVSWPMLQTLDLRACQR